MITTDTQWIKASDVAPPLGSTIVAKCKRSPMGFKIYWVHKWKGVDTIGLKGCGHTGVYNLPKNLEYQVLALPVPTPVARDVKAEAINADTRAMERLT